MNKKCNQCKRELDVEKFHKHKRDGYRSWCIECEKKYNKKYNECRNKKKCNDYRKKYYREHKDKFKNYTKNYKEKNQEYWKSKDYRDRENKYRKKKSLEKKIQVFNHYGNKCECCGENKKEFLCIDHRYGDGSKERKAMGSRDRREFYNYIIKNNYPYKYRILCHNCNMALGIYGYCPHMGIAITKKE